MNDIKNIEFLRTFYCQHILPLVYDESLSYYEQLCKIKAKVNEVIASQNELAENFKNLTKWIDEQLELYAKGQLQEWLDDGTLENIINEQLFNELNAKIDKNTTDINKNVEDINTLNTNLTQLKDKLQENKLGNLLCVGNSYVNGEGSPTNNGIFNRIKDYFYESYSKTEGGTGFVRYSNHNINFYDLIKDFAETNPNTSQRITHILICSAIGDIRAFKELDINLPNEIKTISQYCKTAFPNAKIYIANCTGEKLNSFGGVDFKADINVHNQFMKSFAENTYYLGWIGWNIEHNAKYFSSDGYHPNDIGYELLANQIMLCLNGGTLEYRVKKESAMGSEYFTQVDIFSYIDRTTIEFRTTEKEFDFSNTSLTQLVNLNRENVCCVEESFEGIFLDANNNYNQISFSINSNLMLVAITKTTKHVASGVNAIPYMLTFNR